MAVNYLTLRSTLFYNTPGGASIPAGYMNTVSTNGVNTLWTNDVALHNTTFSTLTGSTITSVSSIGVGTSNPSYNLDVTGPTRLQTLQQSDTNSTLNVRGFQNTGYSAIPITSSSCISYTGQYMAGINSGQIAVSNNYGSSFTNSSSITNPVLVKMSGNGQYLLCINNNSGTFSVYLSTNYGVSWGSSINSFTGNNLNFDDVCFSYDGTYQYFLLTYTIGSTPYKQLYRSSNFGTSFQAITQPTSSSLTAICCSSNGQNVVIATDLTIYYSTNYGDTWTVSTYSGAGNVATVTSSSSGQYVMVGSYGYPQWSNNYGATFTASTGSLPSAFWYTASSASGQYVIASNYNAQTMYYSTDYGQTFTQFTVPAITYNSIAVSQTAQYIIASGSTSYVINSTTLKNSLITTGYAGIGTAAPAANLHVHNSNASFTGRPTVLIGDGQVDAGGTYGMLQLVRANNGADNKAHLSFVKNGLTVFGMGYYPGASQSVFGLVPSFGTMATNAGLWIATNGYVGIGTTGPSYLLHGYGNVNSGVEQYFQNANSGSSAYTLIGCRNNTPSQLVLFLNSSTRAADGGTSTATLRNDAGALRLQSSTGATSGNIFIAATNGYVGIGNSAPLCKLYVQGTETTAWAGMSYFGGTNWGFVCGQYDSGNVYAGVHNAALNAWGNLILCAGGNCGIGIAPSYKLHVSGTSYLAGEVYGTSWFRVVGTGGVWWESYARGIRAADIDGASYGNITTHGAGINDWSGYDILGRYTFMANGATFGLHDRNYTWAIRSVNGTTYFDRPVVCNSSTTCAGSLACNSTFTCNSNYLQYAWANSNYGTSYYNRPYMWDTNLNYMVLGQSSIRSIYTNNGVAWSYGTTLNNAFYMYSGRFVCQLQGYVSWYVSSAGFQTWRLRITHADTGTIWDYSFQAYTNTTYSHAQYPFFLNFTSGAGYNGWYHVDMRSTGGSIITDSGDQCQIYALILPTWNY